jgi:hypothetical protein
LLVIENCLTDAKFITLSFLERDAQTINTERSEAIESLQTALELIERLSLPVTLRQLRRLIGKYKTDKFDETLGNACDNVQTTLWDEVSDIHFLYLNRAERDLFKSTAPFGEEVKSAFPSANVELVNAARCYALEQSTACVFHLVRSAEIVVRCLMAHLQIPLPTKDGDRNWGSMLKKIRDQLDVQRANPPSDEWLFCDKAYSFLQSFKNPLRNNTMHVDATYDQMSAKAVYDALSGFVRHAAMRLKE